MEERISAPVRISWSQCMRCKTIGEMEEYHGLDLTRYPEGKEELLKGEFFQWRCAKCGLEADTAWPCWYLDPEAKLGIALVPGIDSSAGDRALQAMDRDLEGLGLPDMERRAAGNFYAMQEIVRARDLGLDDRTIQLVKPLIIGQLQARGELVWNGFFQGVIDPDPSEEPIQGVLYASQSGEPEYGRPIYRYDIHLTDRTIVHAGVNEMIFQMCQGMLEQLGEDRPDDGRFHLYDLNWAIRCHDRLHQG